MRIRIGLLIALFALNLQAATFNLFSPATGLLKGNASTYITAAGTSSDVISLWSGTCNASAFLRGDGACASFASGTVTSVALSAPNIFTISGSPVTSSGTLTLTANGTSGGIPYFSATNALSSSALLTANAITLGGGAGAAPISLSSLGTSTTLLHGNASGAPTFAAVSLTADVTGILPPANGGAVGANPSATIGLSAINGTATTYLTSDSAPALSQAIVPTWTGIHTWSLAEPRLLLNESDQSANKKLWDIDVNSSILSFRTRTDADGAGVNWLSVTRGTTTAVTNITLGNATNNPTYTLLGTGNLTANSVTFIVNAVQTNGTAIIGGMATANGFQAGGSPSLSGCSLSGATGSQSAGKFTSGTTGTCTVVITMPAAVDGWTCIANDLTTVTDILHQTATTTTSCTVSGTTVSGDTVTYMGIAW